MSRAGLPYIAPNIQPDAGAQYEKASELGRAVRATDVHYTLDVGTRVRAHDPIAVAKRQLRDISRYKQDWNTYGAEPPNARALLWASRAMDLIADMEQFAAPRVVASTQGGASICFMEGNTYASLDFFNSGEIVALRVRRPRRPGVRRVERDLESLSDCLKSLRDFFTFA